MNVTAPEATESTEEDAMRASDTRYLLRVWRDGDSSDGVDPWRASLRSLRTQETRHFQDLCEMVHYLKELKLREE